MSKVNILLFLSDYKNTAKEESYNLESTNRWFTGIQTNDAPIRYMYNQAILKGDTIERIICITSYKVLRDSEGEPQLERFKDFIKIVSDEVNMMVPELITIPYDYDENTSEKKDYGSRLPAIIYDRLSECFLNVGKGETVYIDYTGGLRDISFLMTAIIRFLEFKGLFCSEIVYSNFFNKKIYDIHYIYDLYQLINGVNEFTNTGNARELGEVYNNSQYGDSANGLVESIIEFSEALSICDISRLDERLQRVKEELLLLENSRSNDINIAMLRTLAPTIRKKLYLDGELNYPKMIRWCVENNMIQQAVTIYTDKMPIFYFENELVPEYVDIDRIRSEETKPGHTPEDTGFYTELFDRSAEGLEVEEFRQSLQRIVFDRSIRNPELRSIIRKIDNEMSCNHNQIIRRAYDRLKAFIRKCYCNGDFDISQVDDYYRVCEYSAVGKGHNLEMKLVRNDKVSGIRSFIAFWGNLVGTSSYWMHKFLYDDESWYLKFAPTKNGGSNVYRKKLLGVQRIKDQETVLDEKHDSELTYKIMAYYLAVKIVRNRMNHAGESGRTVDEETAIEGLNALGIGMDFEDTFKSYKNVLLQGINLTLNEEVNVK